MELNGVHQEINLELGFLSPEIKELTIISQDRWPVSLCHALQQNDASLTSLKLSNVNLSLEETVEAPRTRRVSKLYNPHRTPEAIEEQLKEKDEQELKFYKRIFSKWDNLTVLEILDGSGVMTEPIHYIKSLSITSPLLHSLKIAKSLSSSATGDDLNILDNGTLSSLAELLHLKILHLIGFAGRQDRYQRYLFTSLDNGIECLAQLGKLEELHFSQSGITFRGIFSLIKNCKNMRALNVEGRFGSPGLFTLHHNMPFLKGDEERHHGNSATYIPLDPESPRQVTLTLTNVMVHEDRYDPGWVNETYPEEIVTIDDGLDEESEDSEG